MSQPQDAQASFADGKRKPMIPSAGAEQAAKLKEMASEDWMHPMKLILTSLVVSVLIGLIVYYTATNLLQVHTGTASLDHGIFGAKNWLTLGGGILFFLFVVIGITLSGATFAMSHRNNGSAAIWTILVTALIGVIYYFVFAAAREGRKDQFALWSVLATIVAILVPAYGWWTIRNISEQARSKGGANLYDPADQKAIAQRYTWSMGTLAGSVLFTLISAAGLWQIYGAIPV